MVLTVIYGLLIGLAAIYSDLLKHHEVPHDQMLSFLARVLLGRNLGIAATGAVVLACFTTLVALLQTYTDFLRSILPPNKWALFFGLLFPPIFSGVFSFVGLTGITKITAPFLEFFYPVLVIMTLVRFLPFLKKYDQGSSTNTHKA